MEGQIGVTPGDGIGPEIVTEAKKVLDEIGKKYGPFDWALMENGQYDPAWHSVHCHPDEVVQATEELQARNMIPVHHSKFSLAKHAWFEPITRISEYSKNKNYRLATPMIE